jgi:uncharacterized protein (DUF427 family)
VWDYPRPPALDFDTRLFEVRLGHTPIARTRRAVRVLETASPPTVYFPPEDVDRGLLRRTGASSFCEWKGLAHFWDVVLDTEVVARAAWSYADPFPEYADLTGYLAFYPSKLACSLNGQRVSQQPGHFYGGWVSPDIVGPFKGDSESAAW